MASAEGTQPSERETPAAMAPGTGSGNLSACDAARRPDPRALAEANRRLDLKALRMAVHGWWLGNPLVYKPGVADLVAVARELAAAGAASGTIVIGEAPAAPDSAAAVPEPASTLPPPASHPNQIEAVLILRPPLPLSLPLPLPLPHAAPIGAAALHAVAETAQTILEPDADTPCSCSCIIQWPSEVVLSLPGDQAAVRLCSVDVEEHTDVAYVGLRLALDQLRIVGMAGCNDGERPAGGVRLFTRPDWREVFLARVLHAFERALKQPPHGEPPA